MNFVGNLKAHNAVQSIQDASDTCHHYENLQNTDQECHQKRFLASETGAFNEQKTKSKKKAKQTKKILCVYAYIERQYLFVNPLPCNYGQGEPNLHILQVSLQ